MKTITRFFLLLAAVFASISLSFAGQTSIDFETVGNTWSWSTFEYAPAWSVVANPSAAGINTSAKVGKLVINPTDQPWAGVQCAKGDFGPFTLNSTNCIIKMMVYKDVISPVGIKLVTATDASKGEIKVSNTKVNEWEELTFDFTSQIDPAFTYTAIVFFTDFPAARTAGSTTYIDNIFYTSDAVTSDTEVPTAFTASAGNVSSSNITLKLNATDNSGKVNYTISYGNTVLNTSGISGVEKLYTVTDLTPLTPYSFSVVCKDAAGNTAANNPIIVSATTIAEIPATKSTIDFETIGNTWTWSTFESNPTWSIVSNPSVTGINTSATVGKIEVKATDQQWGGLQCAHGDFGPLTISETNFIIKMMVYKDVISPVGIKLVIADGGSQGELKVSNTKINEWEELVFDFTPQIRAGWIIDQIVIFPDFASRTSTTTTYIDNIVYTADVVAPDNEIPAAFTASLGTVSATDVVLKLNATDNSGKVKYTISYGNTVLNTAGNSGVETQYTVTGLTASTPYSFSVVCKDASGNAAANNPIVVSATTSAAMLAAPVPTVNAANVMSVFSDTYTALPTAIQDWYGNSFSTVTLDGNTTFKNTSLCCMGYEFTAKPIDVSSMSKLHIDIYPVTLASMTLGLVTSGGENKKSNIVLTTGQWNSIDIVLADLPGAVLTSVNQIGFWDLNGTFYMDNLYFWKVGTGVNKIATTPAINCYMKLGKLTVSSPDEISELTVRNLLGQNIKTEVVNANSKVIDLTGVATGNYFIVAKMSNGQVSTQKFSKN